MIKKKRLLIADDAAKARDLLKELLHNDYEIIEARNGLEATQILHAGHAAIDGMILDIHMPVLDGYGVLKYMKENDLHKSIPVIVLTGASDVETKIECYKRGALDVIEKPFDDKYFKLKINNLFNAFKEARNSTDAGAYEKEKSNFLRAVLDSLPVAVFVHDAETWRIKYRNAVGKEVKCYSVNNHSELPKDFLTPQTLKLAQASADKLVNGKIQEPFTIEDHVNNQRLAIIYNAIQNEEDKITEFVATIANIS